MPSGWEGVRAQRIHARSSGLGCRSGSGGILRVTQSGLPSSTVDLRRITLPCCGSHIATHPTPFPYAKHRRPDRPDVMHATGPDTRNRGRMRSAHAPKTLLQPDNTGAGGSGAPPQGRPADDLLARCGDCASGSRPSESQRNRSHPESPNSDCDRLPPLGSRSRLRRPNASTAARPSGHCHLAARPTAAEDRPSAPKLGGTVAPNCRPLSVHGTSALEPQEDSGGSDARGDGRHGRDPAGLIRGGGPFHSGGLRCSALPKATSMRRGLAPRCCALGWPQERAMLGCGDCLGGAMADPPCATNTLQRCERALCTATRFAYYHPHARRPHWP